MTLSCGVNLKLALRFHALLTVTINVPWKSGSYQTLWRYFFVTYNKMFVLILRSPNLPRTTSPSNLRAGPGGVSAERHHIEMQSLMNEITHLKVDKAELINQYKHVMDEVGRIDEEKRAIQVEYQSLKVCQSYSVLQIEYQSLKVRQSYSRSRYVNHTVSQGTSIIQSVKVRQSYSQSRQVNHTVSQGTSIIQCITKRISVSQGTSIIQSVKVCESYSQSRHVNHTVSQGTSIIQCITVKWNIIQSRLIQCIANVILSAC